MTSPPDRDGGSDDPLRYSPLEGRNGDPAKRGDVTLLLPARRIRDLGEENIGLSATSPLGEGSTAERVRARRLADPDILAPDILELEIEREAPGGARGRFGTFGRFALAISIPAVVVIAASLIFRTLAPGWTDAPAGPAAQADSTQPRLIGQTQASVEPRTQGTEPPNSPRPRLLVLRAPSGGAGDAIPLGLSLAGASGDAALLLTGLPVGWTISTGFQLGTDNWVLTARELDGAAIRRPRGFVGAIDLAIELRLADDTVADHLSLHLTWPEAPKAAMAIETAQTPVVAAAVGTGNTGSPLREAPSPQATTVPLRRLDRDEIADLRKRGEEFMAAGNLGLARLALQRAAEGGDPQAAFALATTYDPILLDAGRVIGVVPDSAAARAWYEKAKKLGSTDASLRLKPFASRDR